MIKLLKFIAYTGAILAIGAPLLHVAKNKAIVPLIPAHTLSLLKQSGTLDLEHLEELAQSAPPKPATPAKPATPTKPAKPTKPHGSPENPDAPPGAPMTTQSK
jgi:hypothetical protein